MSAAQLVGSKSVLCECALMDAHAATLKPITITLRPCSRPRSSISRMDCTAISPVTFAPLKSTITVRLVIDTRAIHAPRSGSFAEALRALPCGTALKKASDSLGVFGNRMSAKIVSCNSQIGMRMSAIMIHPSRKIGGIMLNFGSHPKANVPRTPPPINAIKIASSKPSRCGLGPP